MPSVLLPFKCNDAAYVAPASSVHEPLIPFITCDFIELQVDIAQSTKNLGEFCYIKVLKVFAFGRDKSLCRILDK